MTYSSTNEDQDKIDAAARDIEIGEAEMKANTQLSCVLSQPPEPNCGSRTKPKPRLDEIDEWTIPERKRTK